MGVLNHGVRNHTNASAVSEFCVFLALQINRTCLILLKIS